MSCPQLIRPMTDFDLFLSPLIQGNTLTTWVSNMKPRKRNTVDIHFSDVRPDFAVDAGTIHTVHLLMSAAVQRCKNECAPDKNAQIVRRPSRSTCFTVRTDIYSREESAVLGLHCLRRPCAQQCGSEDTYHFLLSKRVPRGYGGSARPRSC